MSGREHIILVKGNHSKPYKVSSGVAQGSCLGPLLLKVTKHSEISLFADDCRISKQIKNPQDGYKLQEDLNRVIEWVKDNGLKINEGKCQKISFARKSEILSISYFINATPILEVNTVRDFGVILDRKWTFSEQIKEVFYAMLLSNLVPQCLIGIITMKKFLRDAICIVWNHFMNTEIYVV